MTKISALYSQSLYLQFNLKIAELIRFPIALQKFMKLVFSLKLIGTSKHDEQIIKLLI